MLARTLVVVAVTSCVDPPASTLLTEADIRARTSYDGDFTVGTMNGERDTPTFSSVHFKALGRRETWDVGLRVWTSRARLLYDGLVAGLPHVTETVEIASASFRTTDGEISGIGFVDDRHDVAVLLTCGAAQCTSIDDAVALARTVSARIARR